MVAVEDDQPKAGTALSQRYQRRADLYIAHRPFDIEAAAGNDKGIELRGADLVPVEAARVNAGRGEHRVGAGGLDQLRHPVSRRKGWDQPFEKKNRRARIEWRDCGKSSAQTLDKFHGGVFSVD